MSKRKGKKRKSKPRRPFWQTMPCPSWCWGHHSADDGGPDRTHWSKWCAEIELSLPDAETGEYCGEPFADPVVLQVCLTQHYRESTPRVLVEPEHTSDGSRYELTVAEAAKLAAAIAKAVELAESVVTR